MSKKKGSKNNYSALADEDEENFGSLGNRGYSAVGSISVHIIRPPVLDYCALLLEQSNLWKHTGNMSSLGVQSL